MLFDYCERFSNNPCKRRKKKNVLFSVAVNDDFHVDSGDFNGVHPFSWRRLVKSKTVLIARNI